MMQYYFCHAPHPHQKRPGERCSALILAMPISADFSTIAVRMPDDAGTDLWVKCPKCRVWNRFVLVSLRSEAA